MARRRRRYRNPFGALIANPSRRRRGRSRRNPASTGAGSPWASARRMARRGLIASRARAMKSSGGTPVSQYARPIGPAPKRYRYLKGRKHGYVIGQKRRKPRRRRQRSYFTVSRRSKSRRRRTPRYSTISLRKRKSKKRRSRPMARRHRRPRRRRYIRTIRRVPKRRAYRRARRRIGGKNRWAYYNPRRRRHRHRRHRRSNPGGGGFLMGVLKPYAIGFVAAMGVAALDTFVAKKFPSAATGPVNHLIKVGTAFAIALGLRKKPDIARTAIVAIAATSGYNLGSQLVGGMAAAQTPGQAAHGLGMMAGSYPEMGALLQGGIGALLNGMGNYGPSNQNDVVANYASALAGMGDDE